MADKEVTIKKYQTNKIVKQGSAGGLWFLGFIGALVYYLHVHSGTFWLVVLALIKATFWPAFLVYHLLNFMRV